MGVNRETQPDSRRIHKLDHVTTAICSKEHSSGAILHREIWKNKRIIAEVNMKLVSSGITE